MSTKSESTDDVEEADVDACAKALSISDVNEDDLEEVVAIVKWIALQTEWLQGSSRHCCGRRGARCERHKEESAVVKCRGRACRLRVVDSVNLLLLTAITA